MSIQSKTMTVKSDTSVAETTTVIKDTVTFDVSNMPNGITYKGLKAVLSFAEPIQWNKASTYDALTVVWDDASHGSYASKRPVPVNIELTNEFYWLRTADLDAQVEMYRQEVMQFDGRITANEQAIADEIARAEKVEQELKVNLSNSAFIIGNSYTTGFDEASKMYSVASMADKVFDKAYVRGASAAGFIAYTDHSTVFENLLSALINENSDKLDTITHVIFNSAIGDSRAYLELGADAWRTKMKQALGRIVNTIQTKLPRCKYIGVCYMESIDRNYRTYKDIYETFTDFVNVGRQLFGICSTNKYITFMGFAGWNIVGTKYMNNDHIHPTYYGYNILTSNWLDCLNGTPTYYPIYSTIECPIDASFGGAKLTFKNYCTPERDDLFMDQDFTKATSIVTTDPVTVVSNEENYKIMLNSTVYRSSFYFTIGGKIFEAIFTQNKTGNLNIKVASRPTDAKYLLTNIPVSTNYLLVSDYIYG